MGFEADGNFTWERFDERYTADLADGLGNLASRSLAMIAKYRDGVVPAAGEATPLDRGGPDGGRRPTRRAMDALDLRGGAEAAWELVATANLYIQQVAPWTLAKEGREAELDAALAALARALYRLAVLASPFIPGKARASGSALGAPGQPADARLGDPATHRRSAGVTVRTARGPLPQARACLEVRLSSSKTI